MSRALRTYRHIAQKEHSCDACCDYILPGDLYEGMVFVSDNKNLIVFKKHISPSCGDDPDPLEWSDESRENKWNNLEKSVMRETSRAA